jgi:protein SCO1/2
VVDDGRPVMLNFVYTTCTAVCPITSQVFAEVRGLLGEHRDHVNMVSVSIDPEHDTPRALKTYAKKYGAYGTWTHITSTTAGSVMIQRAFEVWRGDKMNHTPTTFIRCSPSKPWIRFDGFATPQDLVKGLACAS